MTDQINVAELWEGLTFDQRNEIAELAVSDGRAFSLDEISRDIWDVLSLEQRNDMAELSIECGLAYEECKESHFEISDDGPDCPPEFSNLALFILNHGSELEKIDLARFIEIGPEWQTSYETALNRHRAKQRK